jgi:LCP family protein required for cell wall assembly
MSDKAHRTWPQRLVLALNVFLILCALATASGLAYVYTRTTEIQRIELGDVLTEPPVEPGQPQNFLIIGLDNVPEGEAGHREGIGGQRSDTIMVLRVDPASERADLLSFPRDLYVRIPDVGSDRINAAIQHGGSEALIATISGNFDIPIHHYVAIDFDGFQQLVGLVGGIPIYFPEPVRDRRSGLDVPNTGCIVLSPEQALAYTRSRSFEFLRDGRWHTDGTGDLGRISRQQDFIRRAIDRAIDRGVRNPRVLRDLVNAGLDTIVVDEGVTVDDLVTLGQRFRSFNPDTLVLHSLPVADDVVGGSAVLRLVEQQAETTLDVFRGTGQTGAIEPGAVRATVLNGTGQSGRATQIADELRRLGFTVAAGAVGDAERFDFNRSVIRFQPGFEEHARLLERYLVAGANLEQVDSQPVGPVVLVVGGDWAGLLDAPREPGLGGVVGESAVAPPAQPPPPPASDPSSSTTLVGEVPQTPPDVEC